MKKFAIVTGASRGIGREVAIYLAKQEYKLAIIANDQLGLEEVVETIKEINPGCCVNKYFMDLSEAKEAYQQISSIIQQAGRIDVMFNNAGILIPGSDDLSVDDFKSIIDINLNGSFSVAKAVLEQMSKQNSEKIPLKDIVKTVDYLLSLILTTLNKFLRLSC